MSNAWVGAIMIALSTLLGAQESTVRGTVNLIHNSKTAGSSSEVVIWLTPNRAHEGVSPGAPVRLVQKNKRFIPHLLVITPGTEIQFPNQDRFFHDVFSIYHGKPFDLGLYEGGAVRSVLFTRPGVSYIFCNIHPEMSAVVIVLKTPYFAVTDKDGRFQISHLPPGRYTLEIWQELAQESELASLSRETDIAAGDNVIPSMTLHTSNIAREHLNKYGEPYTADKSNY